MSAPDRTDYVARTASGVLIRSFAERSLAMAWSDTDGHRDFPGHTISLEVEQRIITSRVLRRDRPASEIAA